MRYTRWLSLGICLLTTSPLFAEGGKAITKAEDGGIELAIAGQYVGKIGNDGTSFGVELIALGNGKFHAVAYTGGLPGAGADTSIDRIEADGQLEGDEVVFKGDLHTGHAKNGQIVVIANDNNQQIAELQRVDQVSPTLGQKPPAGAVVLFDGTSADKFKGGRLTENQTLAVGCESTEKFGDHQLHIEFRTPFMPEARGQGRGNSGVYIQGRYELQVLDSFGLTGENNECGGIYQIAKPQVNMCWPPLQWQTYDIDFQAAKYDDAGKKTKNARVTIKHNGVVIHNNLELPHGTPGKDPEGPGDGPLFLQDHGNPVEFRNIWIVRK